MGPLTLGLLLVAADPRAVIRIEAHAGLDRATVEPLVRALEQAIQSQAALIVVREPEGLECDPHDRCLGELRVRTRAEQVLLVRMIGGPKRVRLTVERYAAPAEPPLRLEMSVSRSEPELSADMTELARRLFPVRGPSPIQSSLRAATPPEPSRRLSIGVLALGLAAGATATVFQLDHNGLNHHTATTPAEFQDLLDRRQRDLALSGALFSLGAAASIASASLFLAGH